MVTIKRHAGHLLVSASVPRQTTPCSGAELAGCKRTCLKHGPEASSPALSALLSLHWLHKIPDRKTGTAFAALMTFLPTNRSSFHALPVYSPSSLLSLGTPTTKRRGEKCRQGKKVIASRQAAPGFSFPVGTQCEFVGRLLVYSLLVTVARTSAQRRARNKGVEHWRRTQGQREN
uniref:Uncharacterized protein n=1 Tax=Knipowitschia caucasica TaxID=637954 RepID=A0AAV2MJI3_KNICA